MPRLLFIKVKKKQNTYANYAQVKNMYINTRAMQLFVAAVKSGNYSEVARREGLSPSSVSRSIQQLEETLGLQLLYRNTRALIPTEAGRIYLDTFTQVFDILNETTSLLSDSQDEPAGIVRINAPVVFGQKHIAPWLAELSNRFPLIKIELTQTDDFIDPMDGAVDLLFRIGPLLDSGLHGRIIGQTNFFLAASKDYLARNGIPDKPEDLLTHNCLVYRGVLGAQRSYFTQPGSDLQILTLSGSLVSNNAETLVSAALNGAGIVMMPDWLIGEKLLSADLIRLLPEYRISPRTDELYIAMLYPHSRYISQSIRSVIDFYAEKFGSPPYWDFNN